MSKSLSRMNRQELANEASRYGYEVEESDTVAELREIVAALREESAAGIDQNDPLVTPESPENDESDDEEPSPDEDGADDPDPNVDGEGGTIDVVQTGPSTYHEAPGENQLLVRVKGDDTRTVLWERHRYHPGGEVFLRGGMTAVVGNTPAVSKLIGTRLVEVE